MSHGRTSGNERWYSHPGITHRVLLGEASKLPVDCPERLLCLAVIYLYAEDLQQHRRDVPTDILPWLELADVPAEEFSRIYGEELSA